MHALLPSNNVDAMMTHSKCWSCKATVQNFFHISACSQSSTNLLFRFVQAYENPCKLGDLSISYMNIVLPTFQTLAKQGNKRFDLSGMVVEDVSPRRFSYTRSIAAYFFSPPLPPIPKYPKKEPFMLFIDSS